MVPGDDSETTEDAIDAGQASYVYCPECDTRASADWSFCRNCRASLGDAEPADEKLVVRNDGEEVDLSEFVDEETGCPKCGHTEAEVDNIATTGDGVTRILDLQNRQYRAVTCTRCGFTELYKGRHLNEVLDLFIG